VTLDLALRATEILLALALIQASAEHLAGPRDRPVFALRLGAAAVLLSGLWTLPALLILAAISLWQLARFAGPYNGGSDRMSFLVLWCLLAAHLAPPGPWQELALGYLAAQLVLSYLVSGLVKLRNPDWRSGQALSEVFAYSAYPATENLRALARRKRLLWAGSWAVMLFEAAFPLALAAQPLLIAALILGAGFHLANAVLFGLNRFVWAWLAAYPSVLWLQERLLA
jgi:uncharacterized membrane protein (DUF485 family)